MYHYFLCYLTSFAIPLAYALPSRSSETTAHGATDLYTFSPDVWLENLAVTHDNNLLLTQLTPQPVIYRYTPPCNTSATTTSSTAPESLAVIDGVTSVLGITQSFLDNDLFYFIGLNFSLSPASFDNNRIYSLRLPGPSRSAQVELVTQFPLGADTILLNGLTTLNADTLLASDSLGKVYAVNTFTGRYATVLSGPAYAPVKAAGVNGVRVLFPEAREHFSKDHEQTIPNITRAQTWLYFTNTDAQTFNRVPINPITGTAVGGVQLLATSATGYDDFAIDQDSGDAYVVTQGGDSIQKVLFNGTVVNNFAGGVNAAGQPVIDWGTSAQLSRRQPGDTRPKKLYVTTNGGLGSEGAAEAVGGQVVVVDL